MYSLFSIILNINSSYAEHSPVQLISQTKDNNNNNSDKTTSNTGKSRLGRRPGDSVISACITVLWLIRTKQNSSLTSRGSFQTYSIKTVSGKWFKKIKESFLSILSLFSSVLPPLIFLYSGSWKETITTPHKSHQLQVLIYSVVISVFRKIKFLKLRRKH